MQASVTDKPFEIGNFLAVNFFEEFSTVVIWVRSMNEAELKHLFANDVTNVEIFQFCFLEVH